MRMEREGEGEREREIEREREREREREKEKERTSHCFSFVKTLSKPPRFGKANDFNGNKENQNVYLLSPTYLYNKPLRSSLVQTPVPVMMRRRPRSMSDPTSLSPRVVWILYPYSYEN